jgi:hypothetical protein
MHSGRGVTEASDGRARWRGRPRSAAAVSDDPFAVLGLPTRPGLSDDDVQAAWRRIAAATHPDREDGGDPARFGAAAAAYAALRTGFGRGEVLADLGLSGPADHRGRHGHRRGRSADPAARAGRHRARRQPPVGRRTGAGPRGLARLRGCIARLRRMGNSWQPGRPGGLAWRVAGAAAVVVVAVAISGWSPGVVGVLAGVLTWLVATAGRALARRRSQ